MKNLPTSLILEKNKIASTNPWIILLDIKLSDNYTLYFCNNTSDVTFKNNIYVAIQFDLSVVNTKSQGELPTVNLRVCNVSRLLMPYLEELSGGVSSAVKIRVVNTAYLTLDYSELEIDFIIMKTEVDAYWVTFTLGIPNPLRRLFPPRQYIAESCAWMFKSAECGYKGTSTSCDRQYDTCRKLGNTHRFGGFRGLSGVYYRFI